MGFMGGLLLGSKNLFGDDDAEDAERLRNQNQALMEQNRRLKAEVSMDAALLEALQQALHDADPEHPLICPMEVGANPLRKKICDQAWDAAIRNPNL